MFNPLECAGIISWWDDWKINPGGKWKEETQAAIKAANIGDPVGHT